MLIQRNRYLQKLIDRRENGMVKVITGIRRCGKSYLLFELYHQYLNADGVRDDHTECGGGLIARATMCGRTLCAPTGGQIARAAYC